ncbi:MAG: TetR/AcrR family transcriptional regulator [Sporichthyaceae bacterium]
MPARPAAHRRKPPAPRMNSESYFQAAFEILGESGAEGVTATGMCERLGVTKGSFYYHFYSMPEFIEAFVAYWEQAANGRMDDIRSEADPLQRMAVAASVLADMSHEAEAALRAWGHSNPVVGEAQVRIDRAGEQLALEIIRPFVGDAETAALHAHQLIAMLIGMQHRERPIDRELYLRSLANFGELILGVRTTFRPGGSGPIAEFSAAD